MKPFETNISIIGCVKICKKKLKNNFVVNNIFSNFTFFFQNRYSIMKKFSR